MQSKRLRFREELRTICTLQRRWSRVRLPVHIASPTAGDGSGPLQLAHSLADGIDAFPVNLPVPPFVTLRIDRQAWLDKSAVAVPALGTPSASLLILPNPFLVLFSTPKIGRKNREGVLFPSIGSQSVTPGSSAIRSRYFCVM